VIYVRSQERRMRIKEKHYKKIVDDIEKMHKSSYYFLIFSYPPRRLLYPPYVKVCTYHLISNSNSVFNVTYNLFVYPDQDEYGNTLLARHMGITRLC